MTSRRLAGVALYCVGVGFLSACAAVVSSGPFWARTYLYLLAWAGILLVFDGLNAALSGESLLLSTPARFLGLYALSVPWWLLFELLNFRLGNWTYQGLPAALPLRWAGYALAFGTVLPALAEARQLVATALPLRSVSVPGFRIRDGLRDALFAAGLLSLALTLLWPDTFFPLVWGFAFLLLEPGVSRRAPLESVLFDLSMGSAEALLAWMGGGMLCGALWEAANWWAGGRWVYTLPVEAGPRLFEMPLAGYAGFPPFALECASVSALASWAWPRLSLAARAAAVFAFSAFSAAAFTGIDAFTVRSFAP